MALKKMRVSFDLDIEVFAQILAKANSGIKIDMFGDEARVPREKLLPRIGHESYHQRILNHMKKDKEKHYTTTELKAIFTDAPNAVHGALNHLFTNRLIKRPAKATYQLTALGVNHGS